MSDDKKPPLSRGWKRAKELQRETEREFDELKTALVACLGRDPTAVDIVAVEVLVASVISARRLRAQGKNDADERKTVLQAIRATGLKPPPPTAPAEQSSPYGILLNLEDEKEGVAE